MKNPMVTISVLVSIFADRMYGGDAEFHTTIPYEELDHITPEISGWMLCELKNKAIKEFDQRNSKERNK